MAYNLFRIAAILQGIAGARDGRHGVERAGGGDGPPRASRWPTWPGCRREKVRAESTPCHASPLGPTNADEIRMELRILAKVHDDCSAKLQRLHGRAHLSQRARASSTKSPKAIARTPTRGSDRGDRGAEGQGAGQAGLWNLFLPESERGAGLTNLEYAPLCEDHGPRAAGRRKCSTARRRTPATWKSSSATARDGAEGASGSSRCWSGEIRSALRDDRAGGGVVAMRPTSPAGSSATATSTSSTAASGGPRAPTIRAARSSSSWARPTRTTPSRHSQQSMILVPRDTPGVNDPAATCRCSATTMRRMAMPRSCSRTCACRRRNILLGEGRAASRSPRARLGPGRIHHCMRLIGLAERALEKMMQAHVAARRLRQADCRADRDAGAHRRGAHHDRLRRAC